jgi:hypothetical protein
MPANTTHGYVMIGEFVAPDTYTIRAKRVLSKAHTHESVIDAARLADSLYAKGCEFCAYQVKLRLPLYCDHVALSVNDLLSLGFGAGHEAI